MAKRNFLKRYEYDRQNISNQELNKVKNVNNSLSIIFSLNVPYYFSPSYFSIKSIIFP